MTEDYWTRRLGRRRMLRGAGLAAGGLATAMLIGCSGDEDAEGSSNGSGTPAVGRDDSPQAADGPRRGGTLTYDLAASPPNFDMHANSTYLVNAAGALVYNQLVQFDPLSPAESPEDVVPDLAERWEQSEDGATITFQLVSNARFQNGQQFSSADVKASLERIQHPPEDTVSPRQAQFDPVERIEAPDDRTVVIHLSRPAPSLLPLLAQSWNAIYSAEDIANDFDFQQQINGTGPFRFADYRTGNRFDVVRNDEYHVSGRPYLDGVTLFIVPETSTAIASFQSGDLQLLRAPGPSEGQTLTSALGDQIEIDGPMPTYNFLSLNFGGDDPWRDVRARRAVSMALDRDAAIRLLHEGDGYRGGYLAPEGIWGLPATDLDQIRGFEAVTEETLTEARALLDAAGVAQPLEISILTRQGGAYEKLALYIQDQVAAIGVNATPNIVETASAFDALNSRNFALAPWVHGYAVDDPDAVFSEFYTSDAPRNYSDIGSPELDDLYLQQSSELNLERRRELVHELESMALELYGKVIITWAATREARWQQVRNRVKHPSTYNNQRFEDVWLAEA